MPHIHTGPGQHDLTTSAYIVRMQDDEPLVLVHMHKRFGKLMQAGGHVELSETPWSALCHELKEETGYDLKDLSVLQPGGEQVRLTSAVTHPTPLLVNTHKVSDNHLHTDLCYGFVARTEPATAPGEGESHDLRWLTLSELKAEVENAVAFDDVYLIYKAIVEQYLEQYEWVHADEFSIDDPEMIGV